MEINKEQALEILKALTYQDYIEESNKEFSGEELEFNKPMIKKFINFCELTDKHTHTHTHTHSHSNSMSCPISNLHITGCG